MSRRGELLVAIMNDKRDFAIAQQQNWYRIPVSSAAKWLQGPLAAAVDRFLHDQEIWHGCPCGPLLRPGC